MGRSILIVEDEPLIALDIVDCFRQAGASVYSAQNLRDGLRLVHHPDLRDGDGAGLCDLLKQRGVPFVLHTGYSHPNEAFRSGVLVPKPAAPLELVTTLTRLLSEIADVRVAGAARGVCASCRLLRRNKKSSTQ